MEGNERRQKILQTLREAGGPVSGTRLAQEPGVSRQVIVGDVALLRAQGQPVIATAQGYLINRPAPAKGFTAMIACRHGKEHLVEELRMIVERGGKVLDVFVEHPVYGEIRANLMVETLADVEDLMARLEETKAEPLSLLTGGIHLHTIEVPDRATFREIERVLMEADLLVK